MDIRQEVLELIFRVAKIGRLKLNRQLTKKGLTLPQYLVINTLYEKTLEKKQTISPADISDFTDISRSTMTGIIDRLERNNLLVRKQNPEDRRSQCIDFTENGLALVKELRLFVEGIQIGPLKALSEKQLLNLKDSLILIKKYLRNLED